MTYEKRLGWINTDHTEPVVEAGGHAWMTKGGVPVIVPDEWEGDQQMAIAPLPEELEAVSFYG